MSTETIGFDVDGVLTKPEKRIPNPILISFIVSQLDRGMPIGVITGRTPHWLKSIVIKPIQNEINHRSSLDLLFLSSEKATVTLRFQDGDLQEKIETGVKVPKDLWGVIKKLAEGSNEVYFDDGKVNIPSLEIIGGTEDQVRAQMVTLKKLKKKLDLILLDYPDFVVLDEPGIALDIQHKSVDKTNAAEAFVRFVESKGIKNPDFIIFGDTISDVRLAQRMWSMNYHVRLAYVGVKDLPSLPFVVIKPDGRELYDEGTVSILKTLRLLGSSPSLNLK